jgi:hypothetical protein
MRHPTSASSRRILAPTRLPDAVVAGVSRDALKRDVDAGRLSRPFRGVYAPVDVDSHRERLTCAALHAGPDSIVVAGSAAMLHGLAGVPSARVPQLALPPGLERRQRDGIDLHFWDIPDSDIRIVDGHRVTSLLRTVADVCRLLPRFAAVSCVDSALDQGLLCLGDLASVRALMARRRNCVSGRRYLGEARVGAQSPLETRVRLRAADAGFPPDQLQVPVLSTGGVLLGYGDAGYRLPAGGWLIVEADGRSVHELPEALLHDRRRQNAFLAVPGITMVRFTWEDTRHDDYIPAVLRPLLTRSSWQPPSRRA